MTRYPGIFLMKGYQLSVPVRVASFVFSYLLDSMNSGEMGKQLAQTIDKSEREK